MTEGPVWVRTNFTLVDATPDYLFNALAPPRVRAMWPHAKFVVLLRVRRRALLATWSHANFGMSLRVRRRALLVVAARLRASARSATRPSGRISGHLCDLSLEQAARHDAPRNLRSYAF